MPVLTSPSVLPPAIYPLLPLICSSYLSLYYQSIFILPIYLYITNLPMIIFSNNNVRKQILENQVTLGGSRSLREGAEQAQRMHGHPQRDPKNQEEFLWLAQRVVPSNILQAL